MNHKSKVAPVIIQYKEEKIKKSMFKNYYIRLVSLILLIAVCCSVFGQILLKLIEITSGYYKYLIVLTPIILLFTKFSNKYLKTNTIGMKYFIEAGNRKDTDSMLYLIKIYYMKKDNEKLKYWQDKILNTKDSIPLLYEYNFL